MTANDPLIHLRNILEKDPELYFGRIKQLFQLSKDFNKYIKKFSELINNGYVPVIYSNHQSHTDGVILSILIEEIRKHLAPDRLNGFLCPVAASMASGDQNDRVQGGTFIFQPIFNRIGFIHVPIIREDDRRKYGMEGSNREAIERLIYAPRDNYGLVVFPEGTVQGGRAGKDGRINGMQQVEGGGILLRCISFWRDQGKKSVLLPVGIVNSYQIFNPDRYDLPKALMEMIGGESKVSQLVNVVVGEPITSDEINQNLGKMLDPKKQEHIDYLMKKIALLLPVEARGYYGG